MGIGAAVVGDERHARARIVCRRAAVTAETTVGSLNPTHRSQVEAILRATSVFSQDEIAVALELFDSSLVEAEYEFVGAFEGSGALVGFACYGSTPSTNGAFDLYWLAVHPDAQG